MELVKQGKPLELVWKDVTFLIKATATAGDQYALTNGAAMTDGGKQKWTMTEFWRKIIELSVIGWRGVMQDGKEVPFSMEALDAFPADPGNDVFIALGGFIVEHTGLVSRGEARKNESGQSLSSSPVQEPSTASGSTALKP